MTPFMTEKSNLITARALVNSDFVITEWVITNEEDAYRYKYVSGYATLTLKQENFDNLVETWKKIGGSSRLWQDWNINLTGDSDWYKKISLGAEFSRISIDFRGCKTEASKQKKVQNAVDTMKSQVRKLGNPIIASTIQNFNEKVARLVKDRNYWTLENVIAHCTSPASYDLATDLPEYIANSKKILELQEELKTLQMDNQRIFHEFLVKTWSNPENNTEYPEEVRVGVVEKAKARMSKPSEGMIIPIMDRA